jgi:hypothetical protein
MKKRLTFGVLLIMAALSLHDLAGFAQSVMTPPGKLVNSAQWIKMIDDDKPQLGAVAGQAERGSCHRKPSLFVAGSLDPTTRASTRRKLMART